MITRVLVLGNFGYLTGQIDGQTVKTRTIHESLSHLKEVNVKLFDVSLHGALSVFFILRVLRDVDHVIFLPGIKQLLVMSPLLLVMRRMIGYKLHYVVVGGWITSISRYAYVGFLLKRFDSINCELDSMRDSLRPLNTKTYVLSNYRNRDPLPTCSEVTPGQIRLVFLARVMKEKGVFEAIELAKVLHQAQANVTLDIIGPLCFIDSSDSLIFNKELEKHPDFLSYRGCIDPFSIQSELYQYDVLVFPTRYTGEGFPGSIVDAMMSGLCVICTDWLYNKEIVEQTACGYVLSGDFVDEAKVIVLQLYESIFSLIHIKNQSLHSARAYSSLAFESWYESVVKDK